jgi:hypothetical protein
MTECQWLSTCPFFNDKMKGMPSTAELAKGRYCRDAFGECARYMVRTARGKDYVPADMFPDQRERANELIVSARVAPAKNDAPRKR